MCSFGSKYIPYLGYVTTREGIKPDPKKVQGIMDLGLLATTTGVGGKLIKMNSYVVNSGFLGFGLADILKVWESFIFQKI